MWDFKRCPASVLPAPPDYNSVVTLEEAEQRNNLVVPQLGDDLSGILERPLMAFVQEFRFRPPPVYSEVSHRMQTPAGVSKGETPECYEIKCVDESQCPNEALM